MERSNLKHSWQHWIISWNPSDEINFYSETMHSDWSELGILVGQNYSFWLVRTMHSGWSELFILIGQNYSFWLVRTMHSDWLELIAWLTTFNHCSSFQSIVITKHIMKLIYEIGSYGQRDQNWLNFATLVQRQSPLAIFVKCSLSIWQNV